MSASGDKSDFTKRLEKAIGGQIPADKIDEAQRNNAINSKNSQNINDSGPMVNIPALKKPKDEETIKNIENLDQSLKRF